jgi:acyl-coenzyme A synthetase/AMP-(fatty) acid ligase
MMEKITKRKMMKSKKMMIVIMIVTATRTMIAIMGKKRKTPMKEMEVKMMRKESMRALSTKPTLLKVLKHNGEILSRSSSCL